MKNYQFFDLKEGRGDSLFNHLINLVITARLETGFQSNTLELDEDVNIYLASLLQNYMSEDYRRSVAPSIFIYEMDIHAKEESRSIRSQFDLYRHTADYLTVNLGVFNGIVKKVSQAKMAALRLTNDDYIGRARAYYAYASEYMRKLRREKSGVSEVLGKMSQNFQVYLNLLYHLREKYFGMIDRFSEGEWFHLVHKNILHRNGVESKVYVDLMDTFLMALSAWKKDHNAGDYDKMLSLSAELKRLNPQFKFDAARLRQADAA